MRINYLIKYVYINTKEGNIHSVRERIPGSEKCVVNNIFTFGRFDFVENFLSGVF